ncbi:efflux RND transporter periplasmic adaptor subunit [Cognatishimia sp. F0-27]|uniref:efflux RND transporter periplasmic adaptor subunit n=1 Tax=Cognatishimia sp. F0-27 TaxID=2816855 RepID=UPI001D0C3485|nr:efflux RND transporter periplasmic adaptor subunit [Cognatishimia sp. F0-27]MCC1495047.1 efflux RND transporter periplasmic adaptor subunit [Cognatishimia sp. F0-27]
METVDEAPVFVQTAVLEDEAAAMARRFFGEVTALKTVDVSFQVGGYIDVLEAQEGSFLLEGTLIARLDLAPFDRAVARAELALSQAERDLERAEELATRNVGSQVQADNALTARDLAAVALAEARDARSDAEIRAPFDGLVADRLGTPFVTIEPGEPIVRLHNMSEVRVEFDLPERLLAQIGAPEDISFRGYLAGQEAPIPLAFREFRTETNGVGQSYTISLAVEEAPSQNLLPGRTITVEASVPRPQGVVTVPATAIHVEPDGTQILFTVEAENDTLIARRQIVDVTSRTGTQFDVTGIPPQSEIITVGAHLLTDGQPVQRYAGLTIEGL